jgi:hypothetical protein
MIINVQKIASKVQLSYDRDTRCVKLKIVVPLSTTVL